MKKEENFFDSRTVLAVLMVGGTFLGWQWYMQQKYPDAYKPKPAVTKPAETAEKKEPVAATAPVKDTTPETAPRAPKVEEKIVHYESPTLSFDISSEGMGLRHIRVLKYKDRDGGPVELGRADDFFPYQTRLTGQTSAPEFKIEQLNPNLFVGRAKAGGMTITKTMEVNPEKYTLDFKVVASGEDDHFIGLTTSLSEVVEPELSRDYMHPLYQNQEFYVDNTESKDRETFGKSDMEKSWSGVKLAAVGSLYFTQAIVDKSQILPEARAHLNRHGKIATLLLQYPILDRSHNFELNYSAFVGPKSLQLLHNVDSSLEKVVDFGFFNWIGRELLALLRAFHKIFGNWGVAIILLTALVRLLVLPVNLYSYKSMKAMQVLQPQIKALKEKYKDDQQKQQQETMALMKTHKVNPVGGCLPMVLQFPIFWALYRVLENSIELYQAPFGLWIHDLSIKDPFYILPVLMGVTMFFQQKLTPTATMDPAQAKLMLLMPVVFTFFMFSLPCGLTLYMLVGAVFSVAQQSYFMRTKPVLGGMKT